MKFVACENMGYVRDGKTILDEISFSLPEGSSLAITGPSGCGKTTLGRVISGQLKPTSGKIQIDSQMMVQMIDQQENFLAASHMHSGYLGQRYENLGLEDVPTVAEYLLRFRNREGIRANAEAVAESLAMVESAALAEKKVMMLSNGERKRVQIASALLRNPDLLIFDQPFVGLDTAARQRLSELLFQLHHSGKTVIVLCGTDHIPEKIDFVLELKNGKIAKFCPAIEYFPENTPEVLMPIGNHFEEELKTVLEDRYEFAVRMKQVKVVFGSQLVLNGIDWTVRKGERWALMGPNGAGKTTLLSLITADNPQGYSNELYLFDRRRGSGESIWDIKKRIGIVSPELHLYFLKGNGIFNSIPGLETAVKFEDKSLRCTDVIASGFSDLVGLAEKNSAYHQKIALKWMSVLQIGHLRESWFHEASLSEQRLLLLARALVKFPSLLILDEPCQGLDASQTRMFTRMLDHLCNHLDTTLIYVTHYPDEIPESTQFLLQLDAGKVKSCGPFDRNLLPQK